MLWYHRPKVKNCGYQMYCDCPNCDEGFHCDLEGGGCNEDECPLYDRYKKRWITEEQWEKKVYGESE